MKVETNDLKTMNLTDAEFTSLAEFVDKVRGKSAAAPGARPLFAKLVKVMADVKRIPKQGFNSFHNYAYVTDEDVMDALRPIFSAHGVAWFPTLLEDVVTERPGKKGGATYHTRVKMQINFIDPDTGDSATSTWVGTANDDQDKGLYKAITGCLKYALTTTAMLSSGDNPERETQDEQKAVNKGEVVDERPRWQVMLQAFGSIGISRQQIEAKCGVKCEDMNPGQLDELSLMYTNMAKNPKAREKLFPTQNNAARVRATIIHDEPT